MRGASLGFDSSGNLHSRQDSKDGFNSYNPVHVQAQFNEGLSSIQDKLDVSEQDHQSLLGHRNGISPLIKQEINHQINLGLKQFFQQLDRKLLEQKQSRIYHMSA